MGTRSPSLIARIGLEQQPIGYDLTGAYLRAHRSLGTHARAAVGICTATSGGSVIRLPPARRSARATLTLRRRRKNFHDTRTIGHSYPQALYEDTVRAILAQIGRVDDVTITEVVRLHESHQPRADELTLALISRSREDTARLLAKTRDLTAWQATMSRLDAEGRIPREPVERHRLSPAEIVDYTRSVPRLWADSGPGGRQALVIAIFARLDVWASGGSSTSSYQTRSISGSARHCRRFSSSRARLVSLVEVRGLEPPDSTPRIVLPSWIDKAVRRAACISGRSIG